tara:strand:+ start:257 stop:1540 length:1284 start_codon:yes stop_codon:yes gene_type:complete
MHDINFIRNNPKKFDLELGRRSNKPISNKILDLDKQLRSFKTQLQDLQQIRNKSSKEIGILMKKGLDASQLQNEVKINKNKSSELDLKISELSREIDNILKNLPNILDKDVPFGLSEKNNSLIKSNGKIPKFNFLPKDHVELGEKLNQIDFRTAAKLSGARFVITSEDIALLERALISFMLDINIKEFGHKEISPPYLVNYEVLEGTGQLPKFHEDLFKTESEKWLIPTAEVPLTNIIRNEILNENDLPMNFVAYSPCFRAEAGAAGKDTRGMIRQHQFSKVEMVSIVNPEKSDDELVRITNCAETILQKLSLPYRVMLLCSGDTGFSSKKTFDIEVWLPGQNQGKGEYREISSCSNCGDFQSRRMNARYRTQSSKELSYLHTLNGSCLAIGRTIIAILENHQNSDGSVNIPEPLQPYMHGKKIILN